ncbi:MAG: hypothetical protein QW724_02840 [Nitrososphaerota archaeon]
MACFLTPMFIAMVTTFLQKISIKKAEKLKLSILNTLLWGGSILLAVEHVLHGEVVPWPPFLTAMANPVEVPVMLHEMMFTGGLMTVTIFTIWGLILAIPNIMSKLPVTTQRLKDTTLHRTA